jgi:hypothetical protein
VRSLARVGEGRGRGSVAWLLDELGQKAKQADGRMGRLGQNPKRKPFRNKN